MTSVELELQRGKLESQLESQLARQEAWERCEDDALKKANMEERELILKAEIPQLKWMQTNWLWFTKLHKMEGTLKRLGEANQELKKREKANKEVLRKQGYQPKLERAREKGETFVAASGGQARRTDMPQQQASKLTRPSREQEQSVHSNTEAKSVFEFLNESAPDTPDALERLQRANGKP
ncbi:hypothetical protein N0V87_005624 [Didymella glomerata]|uniref:Uncharacterized protein n=1 Tax=Didymella glomerata TaxID=749621 RepID=A0A9W8WY88_9PLEO|nr:hypothetical protein N0V87_005624 [Didymella glomerata]